MDKIRLLIASDFQLARMGLRQIVNALQGTKVAAESELQTALGQRVQKYMEISEGGMSAILTDPLNRSAGDR